MIGEDLDHAPEEPPLFSARLQPYRSLNRRGFALLMVIFSSASLISTLPFAILGAWPVLGFMGIDVVIFYFAFRASFQAAKAYEDLEVTFFELKLAKVSASGERAEFLFNPCFVRLEQDQDEKLGTPRLTLVSRGKAVEIAAFLGPADKADLATDLSQALAEARRGPRFS
ncbi:MAG TPA: DUF2244 domain-containing protein [Methylocella sp.]|nr:DUF2244 domain-containing protein [Methylocella sp.]